MEATATLERERIARTAQEAGWELDALLALLLQRVGRDVPCNSVEEHELRMQIRGIGMRARALCDVMMSANDETLGAPIDAADIEKALFGHRTVETGSTNHG